RRTWRRWRTRKLVLGMDRWMGDGRGRTMVEVPVRAYLGQSNGSVILSEGSSLGTTAVTWCFRLIGRGSVAAALLRTIRCERAGRAYEPTRAARPSFNAATASWSTRLLIASSAWPFTLTKRTSWRAVRARRRSQRSRFLTGFLSAVVQPRRRHPSIQPSL